MASIKFLQTQSFQIVASGASSTDTTLTLQSFKMIDGVTNIVTADLGDKCYGTLEPNNGTQEEAIQFTGVTQNANGTATLTGVSSVGFNFPYTVTSGLSKSHAGGVIFILTDTAGFYGNLKTYIDTTVASGAAFADASTAGISKLSVNPVTGSNPIAVGDNDPRMLTTTQSTYISQVANLVGVASFTYGESITTGDALYLKASDQKVYKSITTDPSTTFTFVGIALSTASSGVHSVQLSGVATSSTTLASGSTYYVTATGGALATTLSSSATNRYQVGVALSSATIILNGRNNGGAPIINTYTTGATWTKYSGLKYVIVEGVGGGGGSGGSNSSSSSSGGGGGGGYSRRVISASNLGNTETASVGGGGSGGSSNTNGVAGGNTSFGSWILCTGGSGSQKSTGATNSPGAGPGVASGGDVNINGQAGAAGTGGSSTVGLVPAAGGTTYFIGFGDGGTGVIGSSGGSFGDNGLLIVTEYY